MNKHIAHNSATLSFLFSLKLLHDGAIWLGERRQMALWDHHKLPGFEWPVGQTLADLPQGSDEQHCGSLAGQHL